MRLKKSFVFSIVFLMFILGFLGIVSAASSLNIINPVEGDYYKEEINLQWSYVGTPDGPVRIEFNDGSGWTFLGQYPQGSTSKNWDTDAKNGDYQIYLYEVNTYADALSGVFTIDNTPPTSSVDSLDEYQNTVTFNVPFSVTDSNPDTVELFYRKDGGDWTSYGAFSSSPISFTSEDDGTYDFYTIATDEAENIESKSATDEASTIVDTTDPMAYAGSDQTVDEDALVDFDGGGSSDENGIVSYSWDFDDSDGVGEDATGETTSYTYTTPGIYTVTLTVEDGAGNSATDTLTVTVNDITLPTVSVIGEPSDWTVNPTGGTADSTCSDNVACDLTTEAYKFYSNAENNEPACSNTYSEYTSGTTFSVTQPGWVCVAIKDTTGNPGFSSPVYFKSSTTIQSAINEATSGDTIGIATGTYAESLNLGGKSLTLEGAGIDSTIIDASALSGYAISNFGDSTTINGLTLKGTTDSYGFKVSHVDDITLEDIKVQDSYGTGIDLNTINNAILNNIEITGTDWGFGLMILDSTYVTVTDIATSGNAWGGVSIQTANAISDNIDFLGTFDVAEDFPLLLEKDPEEYYDITDIGTPSKFEYIVYTFREGNEYMQWFYQETLEDAKTLADSLVNSETFTYSDVIIYDLAEENYYVEEGMFIQDAIDAASGTTIHVGAGLYEERIIIDKPLTLQGATYEIDKNGYDVPEDYVWTGESVIQNPEPALATSNVVDIVSDDVIFEGFVVQSLNALQSSSNDHLLRLDATTGAANDGEIVDTSLDNITIRNNIIGPNTNTDSQDGTNGRMGLYFASPTYPSDETGITNTLITGNKIFGAEGNGNNIFIWGSAENYGSLDRADYTGTIIEYNEIYGSHRSGIEIAGGVEDLIIKYNEIYDNSGFESDDPTALKYGNGIVIIRMGSDKASSTAHGSANIEISNNEIYDNEKNAIYLGPINENHQIINNNIYDNNGWDSLRVDLEENYHVDSVDVYDKTSNIEFNNNLIENSGGYGAQVIGTPTNGFILDATENWWGHITGPGEEGPGDGDGVSANVDFDPWWITETGGNDVTSPESEITLSGTIYKNTGTFDLPYTASDDYGLKRVRLYENGEGPVLFPSVPEYATSYSGTFTRTDLIDGTYEYYTRAVDIRDSAYGGVEDAPSTPNVIIIVDATAPLVTIDEITSLTSDMAITVTGTFTETNIDMITIDGIPATLGEGIYSADIPLIEGENTITVVALDLAGNSGEDYASVTRDTQAPSISHTQTTTKRVIGDSTEITATITDVSGINSATLHYSIDGTPGSASMTASEDVYTATIPASTSGGTVTYYITAEDTIENTETSSTYTITVHDLIWDLASEWNLVSVPKELVESSVSLLGEAAHIWKYDGTSWTSPTTIESGIGYWVDNYGNQEVGFEYKESCTGGEGCTPTGDIDLDALQGGWNLIGITTPETGKTVGDIFKSPTTGEWVPGLYYIISYNENEGRFNDEFLVSTDILNPGEGYWVYVFK